MEALSAPVPDALRGRLTRDDWTRAGLAALLAEGPGGLRVEAIARGLGATKGSFYWHFRDAQDLRAAVLEAWAAMTGEETAATLGQSEVPGRKRLMAFVDLAAAEPGAESPAQALEPALRDWARTDPQARVVLAQADMARIAGVQTALAEAGLGAAAAARGATALCAALLGLRALQSSTGMATRREARAVARAVLEGRL